MVFFLLLSLRCSYSSPIACSPMIIYQRVKPLKCLEVKDADESETDSTGRWIGESKIPELIE